MRIRSFIVVLVMVGGLLAVASPAYAFDCQSTTRFDGSLMIVDQLFNTKTGIAFNGNRGLAANVNVYENFIWSPIANRAVANYDWSDWWLELNDGVSGGKAIRFGVVRHIVYTPTWFPKVGWGWVKGYGDPTIRVEWGYPRDNNGHWPKDSNGSTHEGGTSWNEFGETPGWGFKDLRSYAGDGATVVRLKFFNNPLNGRWNFYIDDQWVWQTIASHYINNFRSGYALVLHSTDNACSSAYNWFQNTWRYSTLNESWFHIPAYDIGWQRERDKNVNWTDSYGGDNVLITCTASGDFVCIYES